MIKNIMIAGLLLALSNNALALDDSNCDTDINQTPVKSCIKLSHTHSGEWGDYISEALGKYNHVILPSTKDKPEIIITKPIILPKVRFDEGLDGVKLSSAAPDEKTHIKVSNSFGKRFMIIHNPDSNFNDQNIIIDNISFENPCSTGNSDNCGILKYRGFQSKITNNLFSSERGACVYHDAGDYANSGSSGMENIYFNNEFINCDTGFKSNLTETNPGSSCNGIFCYKPTDQFIVDNVFNCSNQQSCMDIIGLSGSTITGNTFNIGTNDIGITVSGSSLINFSENTFNFSNKRNTPFINFKVNTHVVNFSNNSYQYEQSHLSDDSELIIRIDYHSNSIIQLGENAKQLKCHRYSLYRQITDIPCNPVETFTPFSQ